MAKTKTDQPGDLKYAETHEWARYRGGILSRLTGDSEEAAARLAGAYKAARDSANLSEIAALANAASAAERFAKSLGAYVEGGYGPGLELGRGGVSTGSIALHDGGVPLRDVTGLAAGVVRLLEDPDWGRGLGARLRGHLLSEHSLEAVVPLYRTAYDRTLAA